MPSFKIDAVWLTTPPPAARETMKKHGEFVDYITDHLLENPAFEAMKQELLLVKRHKALVEAATGIIYQYVDPSNRDNAARRAAALQAMDTALAALTDFLNAKPDQPTD